MDFVSAVLILFVFYVRPQEMFDLLNGLRPLLLAQGFALVALIARPGGINVRTLVRTPHDWVLVIYYAWIVWNSPDQWGAFRDFLPLFLIYLFVVQSLTSMRRILFFLYFWAGFIFFVAFMAVASEYGFDPTGSYDFTHGMFKGRLILNTSMFQNPNALGHSVGPLIPMIYFLMFWKRPIFIKEVGLPLLALPLYCVYLTESKGAYISSFAAIVAAITFARAKLVQVGILVLAGTLGVSALYALPRFAGLQKGAAAGDEALAGRKRSLEFGLKTMRNNTTGVGYKQWLPAMKREHGEDLSLASHNSYCQVGAEHGWVGLMIFIGLLYTALRTTITAKTSDTDEDRIKRCLFVLVLTFAVSAWMIDFAYRATLFMILAGAAAFHRRLVEKNPVVKEEKPVEAFRAERPAWSPAAAGVGATAGGRLLQPSPAVASAMTSRAMGGQLLQPGRPFAVPGKAPDPPPEPVFFMRWNRIGIVDVVIAWIMTNRIEWVWEWVIKNA